MLRGVKRVIRRGYNSKNAIYGVNALMAPYFNDVVKYSLPINITAFSGDSRLVESYRTTGNRKQREMLPKLYDY